MDPGFVSGLARMDSPIHRRGKGHLSQPLGQPLVCDRMFAPRCLHNIEPPWLGSGTSNGGSPPSPQEVRYLKGAIQLRLTLGGGTDHNLQLKSFADCDWANNHITRKSRTGYL
jgi:hypothetical protein